MEARYCKLVLQLVDAALNEEPSRVGLLALLKIADPTFSEASLNDQAKRQSALRTLKALIHPDKHPKDLKRATQRFQETQKFYDNALLSKENRPQSSSRPSSIKFPVAFHVQDKWSIFANVGAQPVLPKGTTSRATISKAIAFKCINFRGIIAHGKPTEAYFNYESVCNSKANSVEPLFGEYGGSLKLDSVDNIKQEIVSRGPVVSTSFQLTKGFLRASEYSGSFETSLVGGVHPLLIVGWRLSAFGEMWLVRGTRGNDDIPIAMAQFSIDDEVLAPKNDFDQTPWQDASKAFDLENLTFVDWYSWSRMETKIKSSALEELCTVIGGLSEAFTTKKRFVLRDKFKKARSRWAFMNNATWLDSEKLWKVELTFCD